MPSSKAGRRCPGAWVLFALLFAANLVMAAQEEKIPPLRPAKNEFGPTFLEQYGLWIVMGICAATVLLALLIIWLLRPKPRPIVPQQLVARRALEALRGRPEDAMLVAEVSRIFRRYLYFAMNLPSGELTTTELGQALRSPSLGNVELALASHDFLQRCDERKFAPKPSPPAPAGEIAVGSNKPPPMLVIGTACNLIDRIETHRQKRLEAAQRERTPVTSQVAA